MFLVVVAVLVLVISVLWAHKETLSKQEGFVKALKEIKPCDFVPFLSSLPWIVIPIALLVLLNSLVGQGLVERITSLNPVEQILLGFTSSDWPRGWELLSLTSWLLAVCGAIMSTRVFLLPWLKSNASSLSKWYSGVVRDLVLLFAATIFTVLATETACDTDALALPLQTYAFSVILIFILMLLAYLFGQRYGFACALIVIALVCLGIAEHFVVLFKGQAMLPSDVLSAGTAANVADGYEYYIAPCLLEAICLAIIAFTILSFVTPVYRLQSKTLFMNLGTNYLCGALVLAVFLSLFTNYKVEDMLGFGFNLWWPLDTYEEVGFIPAFSAALQKMDIEVPDDYSDGYAEEIETTLAASYDEGYGSSETRAAAVSQFDEMQPCVVAVMSEGFCDLSMFDFMQAAGYWGPEFYNSLGDTLQRGWYYVSTQGGGTAITEFEFFTNNSLAYLSGKQPYQNFEFTNVDSLAKQLSAIGYDTTAIHPCAGINYRRNIVYDQLGFDTYLTEDDFAEDSPRYHNGITDAATFDKVLEILRSDDSPQFIFDLTIQNHGGYEVGTVPEEDMTSYYPEGIDSENAERLNVYLAGVNACDNDLAYFINELRNLDRPVVLVYFGDHQPGLAATLVDEAYGEIDDTTYSNYLGRTSYIIWANYDVAGNDQVSNWEDIGANELSAQMLNLIGGPLTEYQKALLATRDTIQAMSLYSVLNRDGSLWLIDDKTNPYYSTLNEIACMQYYNFAKKVK